MTNCFDHLATGAEALGIRTVRLVIFQGGESHEHLMPVESLVAFASRLRSGVASAVNATNLHGKIDPAEWAKTFLNPEPNSDECAYCAAYGTCPNTQEQAHEAISDPVLGAFVAAGADEAPVGPVEPPPPASADVDARLAWAMGIVDHLETWCEAVRKAAFERAMAGNPPPGYGLELGRKGNRKWRDPVAAHTLLRERFRLNIEQSCNLSVKSPTQIMDTLVNVPEGEKPALGPRQIKALEAEIVQSDPKPVLKPVSKIKKPWQPPEQAAATEAFPEELA